MASKYTDPQFHGNGEGLPCDANPKLQNNCTEVQENHKSANNADKVTLEPISDCPTSSGLHFIGRTVAAGQDNISLDGLAKRTKKASHSIKVEIAENGKAKSISYDSGRTRTIVQIPDINQLAGSNKNLKKLLRMIVIQLNKIYDSNTGMLTSDEISFPLQDLVDYGMYKHISSARRGVVGDRNGFNGAADALTNIKVYTSYSRGKKTESSSPVNGVDVLFWRVIVDKSMVVINVNNKLNWKALCSYYTLFPSHFAYKLSSRAFDMIDEITYLMRQNVRKISDKAYFTVSLKDISAALNLPDTAETKNPTRDCLIPIVKAIKEIAEGFSQCKVQQPDGTYTGDYIDIELIEPCRAIDNTGSRISSSVKDIMSHGYLKIIPYGRYYDTMIARNQDQVKAISDKRRAIEARSAMLSKQKEKIIKDAAKEAVAAAMEAIAE